MVTGFCHQPPVATIFPLINLFLTSQCTLIPCDRSTNDICQTSRALLFLNYVIFLFKTIETNDFLNRCWIAYHINFYYCYLLPRFSSCTSVAPSDVRRQAYIMFVDRATRRPVLSFAVKSIPPWGMLSALWNDPDPCPSLHYFPFAAHRVDCDLFFPWIATDLVNIFIGRLESWATDWAMFPRLSLSPLSKVPWPLGSWVS